jgi:hypothetical protein
MTYDELLNKINNSPIIAGKNHCITKIPTLGGRSSFSLCNNNGVISVVNSNENAMTVTRNFYDDVWRRDRALKNRTQANNYNSPNWPSCPNNVLAPYLPALWRHLGIK